MGGWVAGVEEQTGQQGFKCNKNDDGWVGGRTRRKMRGQVKGMHCGLTVWMGLMRGT